MSQTLLELNSILFLNSKDQQDLETYVPLLADNQLIAIFTVLYIIGLIAISMPYILVAFSVGLIPTYFIVKYGWSAVDVMRRRDLARFVTLINLIIYLINFKSRPTLSTCVINHQGFIGYSNIQA